MKKTLLITLLGASLALVGCIQQTPVENQNVNQPTADANQNTNQPAVNVNQNININEPVDPYADWQTYRNDVYGFEFKYPKNWPVPTMTTGVFTGGFPTQKSNWVLSIGTVGQGPCEGADCAQYSLEGHNYLDYNSALESLKASEFLTNLEEKNVNGNKVILFIEHGLRSDQTAVLFDSDKMLKLVNVWGDKNYFGQILETFKLQ